MIMTKFCIKIGKFGFAVPFAVGYFAFSKIYMNI